MSAPMRQPLQADIYRRQKAVKQKIQSEHKRDRQSPRVDLLKFVDNILNDRHAAGVIILHIIPSEYVIYRNYYEREKAMHGERPQYVTPLEASVARNNDKQRGKYHNKMEKHRIERAEGEERIPFEPADEDQITHSADKSQRSHPRKTIIPDFSLPERREKHTINEKRTGIERQESFPVEAAPGDDIPSALPRDLCDLKYRHYHRDDLQIPFDILFLRVSENDKHSEYRNDRKDKVYPPSRAVVILPAVSFNIIFIIEKTVFTVPHFNTVLKKLKKSAALPRLFILPYIICFVNINILYIRSAK